MKKTFAILSLVLSLIFAVTIFAIPVNAASKVTYSASSASGKKGDTVSINVSVSGGTDIWGCSIRLNYDSSKLQYVSSSQGAKFASGSIYNSGSSVNFAGQLASCKSSGGVIYTVKFKILASSGKIPLTVTASGGADNIDSNGNNVPLGTSGGSVTVINPVTGISLDKSSVTLKKGETAQITATVTPADATNKNVTYTSSNTKVATVSGGKITAVGGGTAKITATAGGKSAVCTVSVKVAQTGISVVGGSAKSLKEGTSLRLSTAKVPYDATDSYSVAWSSSDTSVATVSQNGTVTGVKQGSAVITATSNGWKAIYNITVTEKPSETESSTEESTTESTTAEKTTESTTEEVTEKKDSVFAGLFDKNNTVTKGYHYVMLIFVALVAVGVSVPVTALVTSNIVKNKNKHKDEDPIDPIEK